MAAVITTGAAMTTSTTAIKEQESLDVEGWSSTGCSPLTALNFRESRKAEVQLRRTSLPRNPVNSAGRRTGARRSGPMVAALYNAATFLPPFAYPPVLDH